MKINLKTSEFFKGVTDKEYDDCVAQGIHQEIAPKSILFHQGDSAKSCFLVHSGGIKLTKLNEQGREVILNYIHAGEVTAAIALAREWAYPVTAETIEATEITRWDKAVFMRLMRQYPNIAINLMGVVLERLEDVQRRYLELCTENVERRIARTLLRLMSKSGLKTENGVQINLPLSRQNIADYSGTTLYTVSRTLSSWEKKEWIHSGREQITVINPHALVVFAEDF